MPLPTQRGDEHFPQMGPAGQYLVGLPQVGYHAVDATLVANTARTPAQLLASPPNTGNANAVGPVVHSFGVPPSLAIAFPVDNSIGAISYVYITADNSAVYFDPRTSTSGAQAGVRTRIAIFA